MRIVNACTMCRASSLQSCALPSSRDLRMPQTLAQLNKKIAALQAEAEALKRKDLAGVVARIKEAIDHYGLTPADLGFGGKPSKGVKTASTQKAVAKKGGSRAGTPKYRDDAGHTWTGHGRRPQWFVDALAAGKKAEDLLV